MLGRTLRELDNTMDVREYAKWQAYWNVIGGWGPERDNAHAAMLAAQMYGCSGGKRRKWLKWDTYMIARRKRKPIQMSDAEIKAVFESFKKSMKRDR